MSNLPLNLSYILTTPGIFKAMSVVSGLIAMILIVVAQSTGRYFTECTENDIKLYDHLESLDPDTKTYEVCEESVKGTFLTCQFLVKLLTLKNVKNQKESIPEDFPVAREAVDELPDNCPAPWMVSISESLAGFTCVVTLIMLVALLIVDLNDKMQNFRIVDFIAHLLMAVLSLLSTCFIAGFVISALAGTYSCTQKKYDLGVGSLLGYGPYNKEKHHEVEFVLILGLRDPKHVQTAIDGVNPKARYVPFYPEFETCSEEKEYLYKYSLLMVATIFSLLATVFHVVTVLMIMKRNKVTPRMYPPQYQLQYQLEEEKDNQLDSPVEPVDSNPNNMKQDPSNFSQPEAKPSNPYVQPGMQPQQYGAMRPPPHRSQYQYRK